MNTSNHIKFINAHIPEFKLRRLHNNTHIDNMSYEDAKILMAKFAVPTPPEYLSTAYLERKYADKVFYQMDTRKFLLKQTKNGDPYLFDIH